MPSSVGKQLPILLLLVSAFVFLMVVAGGAP
jgi:hypothetical protein